MSYGRNSQLLFLLGGGIEYPHPPPLSAIGHWFDFEMVHVIEAVANVIINLPMHWIEPVNRAFNEARYVDILAPVLKFLTLSVVTLACLLAGFWQAKSILFGEEVRK